MLPETVHGGAERRVHRLGAGAVLLLRILLAAWFTWFVSLWQWDTPGHSKAANDLPRHVASADGVLVVGVPVLLSSRPMAVISLYYIVV